MTIKDKPNKSIPRWALALVLLPFTLVVGLLLFSTLTTAPISVFLGVAGVSALLSAFLYFTYKQGWRIVWLVMAFACPAVIVLYLVVLFMFAG